MLELTDTVHGRIAAPPLVPVRALDCDHLAHMTLGDRALEREILVLFRQQAAMLRARMLPDEPDVAGAAAHTLKGSATGVGVWGVARAALDVEQAAGARDADALQAALKALDAALRDAVADITEKLQADETAAAPAA